MLYPGGKGNCFRHIINNMPPHRVYIESHLGGGNVLENKKPAAINIGIDIDEGLIHRWNQRVQIQSTIVTNNDSRGHRQNRRACRIDKNGEGVPEYRFLCRDAIAFLSSYPWVGDELVYADPPYVMSTRKSGKIYDFEYTDEQHCELLELLDRLPCYVMVSGYSCGLYESYLGGWFMDSFTNSTRRGAVTEYLWTNFKPNGVLHDYSFVGTNFREREKLKRKRQRWLSRIKAMPAAERNCIAEAIDEISEAVKPIPAELASGARPSAEVPRMPAPSSKIAIMDPTRSKKRG